MRTRISRRALLEGGVSFGLALTLTPDLAAQDDPASSRPVAGDLLVRASDSALVPLAVDDIALGAAPIMAWAMEPATKVVRRGSRLNRVLLLRLDETRLAEQTRGRAASGIVAYTAICTHTGCEVT